VNKDAVGGNAEFASTILKELSMPSMQTVSDRKSSSADSRVESSSLRHNATAVTSTTRQLRSFGARRLITPEDQVFYSVASDTHLIARNDRKHETGAV